MDMLPPCSTTNKCWEKQKDIRNPSVQRAVELQVYAKLITTLC